VGGRGNPEFEVLTRNLGEVTVLSLHGELDMATVPIFHDAINRSQAAQIVVDLRPLAFIDSTGIRALIEVFGAGRDGHVSVSFVRGEDHVQRTLGMAGVDQILAWVDAPD
jgi:anti-anti-sigma factor